MACRSALVRRSLLRTCLTRFSMGFLVWLKMLLSCLLVMLGQLGGFTTICR